MKSIGFGKFSLVSYYLRLIDFQNRFFFLFLDTNKVTIYNISENVTNLLTHLMLRVKLQEYLKYIV